jgi:predicted transcriptional regulator
MNFKELEDLITEIADQKKADKSEIIENLADILKIKYGITIMNKERDLIDEVKNKVITKLYNLEAHACKSDADLAKIFKLDLLETDYLDPALDELQRESLVVSDKNQISLTKEGVMKFKEFYGEI